MEILEIGQIQCTMLAQACGTPLMVYDETIIEQQLDACINNFKSDRFETEVVYASKAFACKAMFEKIKAAGASLDVVSGGELYLANQAQMPMDKVYFHGNNKTMEELRLAFDLGCGTIVLDNLMECQRVIDLSKQRKQQMNVMVRINPGIEAHTHAYIMTAHSDSKFGISIGKKEDVTKLIESVMDSKYVNFKGFHMHIGSQIFGMTAFEKAAALLIEFTKKMENICNFETQYLSLGGGFGIKYNACDKPMPLAETCKKLSQICEKELNDAGVYPKKVIIEPGRSIVGEAGYTLYTVGFQKQTENKYYVFVDGGMSDNIRPALYQAKYDCDIANKLGLPKTETVCVAGKNCESGDILIEETQLQPAEEGDLLVMYSTGAYGYSMANNYNKVGRPAVVFVKDKKARLVIRRESPEDLMKLEINTDIVLKNQQA